jgi:hypothetical protein
MRDSRNGFVIAALAALVAPLVLGNVLLRTGAAVERGAAAVAPAKASGEVAKAAVGEEGPPVASGRIAAKFGSVMSVAPSAPAVAPAPPAPPQRADWLRVIGGFDDERGGSWLFLKDDRSGRVLKLNRDGAPSDDGRILESRQDAWIVAIGDASYSVQRR